MLKKFTGITVSKGNARAKVLVVNDLINLPPVPNYDFIVVAPYTTPVMNVILLSAKGIVCETGGLTTHAAIIARDLNIPCLMNVKNILAEVKNGQDIELNTENNEVIIF